MGSSTFSETREWQVLRRKVDGPSCMSTVLLRKALFYLFSAADCRVFVITIVRR